MQTAVSIIALVLSVASLTWQAATFFLAGGRPKVDLLVGAADGAGNVASTTPLREASDEWSRRLAVQGYARPVFVVRVRNKGRMPVTVQQWSLVGSREGGALLSRVEDRRSPSHLISLTPTISELDGPKLPHLVEAGGPEAMWILDEAAVFGFAKAAKESFDLGNVVIAAKVEFGDGRSLRSGESALL